MNMFACVSATTDGNVRGEIRRLEMSSFARPMCASVGRTRDNSVAISLSTSLLPSSPRSASRRRRPGRPSRVGRRDETRRAPVRLLLGQPRRGELVACRHERGLAFAGLLPVDLPALLRRRGLPHGVLRLGCLDLQRSDSRGGVRQLHALAHFRRRVDLGGAGALHPADHRLDGLRERDVHAGYALVRLEVRASGAIHQGERHAVRGEHVVDDAEAARDHPLRVDLRLPFELVTEAAGLAAQRVDLVLDAGGRRHRGERRLRRSRSRGRAARAASGPTRPASRRRPRHSATAASRG